MADDETLSRQDLGIIRREFPGDGVLRIDRLKPDELLVIQTPPGVLLKEINGFANRLYAILPVEFKNRVLVLQGELKLTIVPGKPKQQLEQPGLSGLNQKLENVMSELPGLNQELENTMSGLLEIQNAISEFSSATSQIATQIIEEIKRP